jgi:hypothetical protein
MENLELLQSSCILLIRFEFYPHLFESGDKFVHESVSRLLNNDNNNNNNNNNKR